MPSSCTFTFDDPHAYGAAIRGVNNLEVLLTTKGKFQGVRSIIFGCGGCIWRAVRSCWLIRRPRP